MRLISAKLALLLGLLGPLAGAAADEASGHRQSLNGVWLTASGNLEVDMAPCGAALCGTVVRVISDQAMNQGDSNKAAKPGIGLVILKDFTPTGGDKWYGQIYNRDNGKTYDCSIELGSDGTLKVRPYKFVPLFGQTQVWHRVGGSAG